VRWLPDPLADLERYRTLGERMDQALLVLADALSRAGGGRMLLGCPAGLVLPALQEDARALTLAPVLTRRLAWALHESEDLLAERVRLAWIRWPGGAEAGVGPAELGEVRVLIARLDRLGEALRLLSDELVDPRGGSRPTRASAEDPPEDPLWLTLGL
jgi:hypothetical protein